MTYKLVCPHCHSKMRIRTSVGEHIFMRISYLQCTNEACGCAIRAEFVMTHELSPSGMPNPTVKLPVAPVAIRRQCQASYKSNVQELQSSLFDEEF